MPVQCCCPPGRRCPKPSEPHIDGLLACSTPRQCMRRSSRRCCTAPPTGTAPLARPSGSSTSTLGWCQKRCFIQPCSSAFGADAHAQNNRRVEALTLTLCWPAGVRPADRVSAQCSVANWLGDSPSHFRVRPCRGAAAACVLAGRRRGRPEVSTQELLRSAFCRHLREPAFLARPR